MLSLSNPVALVHSSSTLLHKEYGSMIDTFEDAVMFNLAPVKGYELYTGSKHTLRVVCCNTVQDSSCLEIIQEPKVLFLDDLRWHQKKIQTFRKIIPPDRALVVSRPTLKEISKTLTVGLGMICLCLKMGIVPHVFGSGIFEEDGVYSYYWHNKLTPLDKVNVYHNLSQERQAMRRLSEEGKIVLYH